MRRTSFRSPDPAESGAALAVPGLPPIHPLHPRRWTPLRVATFLAALDATGSVGAAARAAGMSRQSAYRLRARRAELRALWALAERSGLGAAMPDRADLAPFGSRPAGMPRAGVSTPLDTNGRGGAGDAG